VPVLVGAAAFDGPRDQGVCFVLDLTERKRAEEALRESEAKFSDYAATASDWLWEIGPDYKYTLLTDNAFRSDPAGSKSARCVGTTLSTLRPNRKSGSLFGQLSIHASRSVTSYIAPWTATDLQCT